MELSDRGAPTLSASQTPRRQRGFGACCIILDAIDRLATVVLRPLAHIVVGVTVAKPSHGAASRAPPGTPLAGRKENA